MPSRQINAIAPQNTGWLLSPVAALVTALPPLLLPPLLFPLPELLPE